jgi:hypothetical protein
MVAADAGAGRRIAIDLRITKDCRHDAPDPTKQFPGILLQVQATKEWSLSRDQVPYSLAKRGITLQGWTNVFDKADALWERRTEDLREVPVVTESSCCTLANAANALAYLFMFYGMHWLYSTDFIPISIDSWQKLVMVFVVMLFLPIVVVLVGIQTKGKATNFHSSKCFETLALVEDDWSRLAGEQRCVFQSFGVDVVPIKEVTTTKGRYHVWTVGLRFSFGMPSTSNNSKTEDCLLMLSNSPTPDAVIHDDLNRLLQLNQTDDVKTEEYELLKSRILSKMSLPKNCRARPVGSTAVMTSVEADTDICDENQVFMQIV